jgi:hypothetical protein
MILLDFTKPVTNGFLHIKPGLKSYSTYPQHLSTGFSLVGEGCEQIGVIVADLRVGILEFPNLPAGV